MKKLWRVGLSILLALLICIQANGPVVVWAETVGDGAVAALAADETQTAEQPQAVAESAATEEQPAQQTQETVEETPEEAPAELAEEPAAEPAEEPAQDTVEEPAAEQTDEQTQEPTEAITEEPTPAPTDEPTVAPSAETTAEVTAEPTATPSLEVTAEPTVELTVEPVADIISLATGLSLSAETPLLAVGDQAQVAVSLSPAGALAPTITYTSSDELVLTVDQTGLVTAVSAGEATLTATATYTQEQIDTALASQAAAAAALAAAQAATQTTAQTATETTTDTQTQTEGVTAVEAVEATQEQTADTATAAESATEETQTDAATEESAQTVTDGALTATLVFTVGFSFVGLGTAEAPFELGTAEELVLLASLVNTGVQPYPAAVYRLTGDINLRKTAWTPIGTDAFPFTGTLNGGSYKLYSLRQNADATAGNAFGLFGVTSNATLTQIALEKGNLTVTHTDTGVTVDAGLIVGRMTGGTLTQSYTTGMVSMAGAGDDAAGGLVGRMVGGEVKDCFSLAGVTSDVNGGVLVGAVTGGALVTTSYSRSEPKVADVTDTVGEKNGTARVRALTLEAPLDEQALTFEASVEAETYQGFDFNNVWMMDDSQNATFPFPVLRANPYTGIATYGEDIVEVQPTGLIPVAASVDNPSSSTVQNLMSSGNGVTSYSIKDDIPAVRDQGAFGTCWTFATVAALESNGALKGLVSKSSVDLAELHTMWFTNMGAEKSSGEYNDPLNNFCGDHTTFISSVAMRSKGGSPLLAMYNLASWMTPAQENGATAYTSGNVYSVESNGLDYSYAFDSSSPLHAKGIYVASMDDADAVKALIKSYGAVAAQYYTPSDGSGYSTCGAFFKSSSLSGSANHAIAIVGWDDSYSKNNFATGNLPSVDGAWLVRNSWGSTWGTWGLDGYFWASYDDYWFKSSAGFAMAVDTQGSGAYDYCYQYDGGNLYGSSVDLGSASVMGANVFTAQHNEKVDAVSFWAEIQPNVSYTVQVYKLDADDDPDGGTLMATKSGGTSYEGYYTVALSSPVNLVSGDRFSVVLTLTRSSGSTALSIDASGSYSNWLRFDSYAQTGQSFVKTAGGATWTDLDTSSTYANCNLRIKAFTNVLPQSITIEGGETPLPKNSSRTLSAKVLPSKASQAVTWSVTAGSDVVTCVDGVVKAKAIGEATVTATSKLLNSVTGSQTITVTSPLAKTCLIQKNGATISSLTVNLNTTTTAAVSALLTCDDAVDAPVQGVTWSVGSTAVANVAAQADGSALVTAVTAGTTTLTATAADGSGVSVTIPLRCDYMPTDVIVSGETAMLGSTSQTLKAAVFPDNVSSQAVTWSLAKPAELTYASITTAGVLAVGNPTVACTLTVTATSKIDTSVMGTLAVTVRPRATGVIIQNGAGTTVTGKTLLLSILDTSMTLKANVANTAKGASEGCAWVNSDTTVVCMETGSTAGEVTVKPLKAGTAKLTAIATDGSGVSAYVYVQVKRLVESIAIGGFKIIGYGKTVQLKTVVLPSTATSNLLAWSVKNDTGTNQTLAISSTGLLSVKANVTGETTSTVTATAKDGSGVTQTYTVTQYPKAIASISIQRPDGIILASGKTLKLNTSSVSGWPYTITAITSPGAASDAVAWKLSTDAYLSVQSKTDTTLSLMPKANGTTTLYAIATDGSGIKAVYTVITFTRATSVGITSTAKLAVGKSAVLTASVTANKGIEVSNRAVTWKLVQGTGDTAKLVSSNAYASISGSTLTIRALQTVPAEPIVVCATTTDGSGISATKEITIMANPVSSVALYQKTDAGNVRIAKGSIITVDITAGEKPELTAVPDPVDTADDDDVVWTSSATQYATVAQTGNVAVVTPVAAGSVIIKATALDGSGKNTYATLQIIKRISGLTASAPATIAVGATVTPTVSYTPANASTRKVTWAFANTAEYTYATLSASTGAIVPKTGSAGNVLHLIAKAADGSGVVSDAVSIAIAPVTQSLAINLNSAAVTGTTVPLNYYDDATASYGTLNLTLGTTPDTASQSVKWTCSNTTVATLTLTDEGVTVQAAGIGTATVTATATDGSAKKATVTVAVSRVVQGIAITAPVSVAAGKTVTVKAALSPATAALQTVSWWLHTRDGSTGYATVTASGLSVKVKAASTAVGKTIQLLCRSTDLNVLKSVYLPVTAAPTALSVLADGTAVTGQLLALAQDATLTLTAQATAGASQAFTWRSLNDARITVTVDESGACTVTRIAQGNATVAVYATDGSGLVAYVYFK